MGHQLYKNDAMMSARLITPWHRLGEVKENVTMADLHRIMGWPVTMEQLYTKRGEATEAYATIRTIFKADGSEDYRIILGDKLSKDYKILQNSELLKVIEPLNSAGCGIETGGTLRNGRRVWVLLRLSTDLVIGKNDIIQKYILCSNDHTGVESARFGLVGIRVVCANTLGAAEHNNRSQLIRIMHNSKVKENLEIVASMLDHVNGQFLAYGEKLAKLADTGINSEDLKKYVKEVFFPTFNADKEREERQQAQLLSLQKQIDELFQSGPGSDLPTAKGTAFGAYQAVNHYLNHGQKIGEDRRTASIGFGVNRQRDSRALALATRIK